MSKIINLFLLFLIPLLFSCQKESTADKSLAKKLNIKETKDFGYFRAAGKASYEHGSRSFNSKMYLRMKEDSILWLSFRPFMGVEAIRCKITRDSVLVMNRLKNKYYQYGIDYFKRKYHLNLSFDNIQSVLLGNLIRTRQGYKTSKEEKQFRLESRQGPVQINTLVDRKNQKVSKVRIEQRNTKNRMTVDYLDFEKTGKYKLAGSRKMKIISRKDGNLEKRDLTLELKNTEFPEKPLDFPFSVPDKFKRIRPDNKR